MLQQRFPIARQDVVVAIACEQVDVPVRVALEGVVRQHHRWRSDGLERDTPALAARLVQLGAGAAGCGVGCKRHGPHLR